MNNNAIRDCHKSIDTQKIFIGLVHETLTFGKIDHELINHIKECKICKRILNEIQISFKEELNDKPEELEEILDNIDVLIHTFCSFEEICNEFWDEERFGLVEEYKKKCTELPIPYEKLQKRIEFRKCCYLRPEF